MIDLHNRRWRLTKIATPNLFSQTSRSWRGPERRTLRKLLAYEQRESADTHVFFKHDMWAVSEQRKRNNGKLPLCAWLAPKKKRAQLTSRRKLETASTRKSRGKPERRALTIWEKRPGQERGDKRNAELGGWNQGWRRNLRDYDWLLAATSRVYQTSRR